jgi:hypothetical protein
MLPSTLENFGIAFLYVLRLVPLSAGIALMLFAFMNRGQYLLQQDRDGRNLVIASVFFLVAASFSPHFALMLILATLAAFWLVVGIMIWLPDWITDRMVSVKLAPVYIVGSIVAYFVGIGFGYAGFSAEINQFTFGSLILPAAALSLFANAAIITGVVSEKFRQALLPEDTSGYYLALLSAVLLTLAFFSTNPVAGVAMASLGLVGMSLGLFVALPAYQTKLLTVRPYALIFYALLTLVLVMGGYYLK